jgi:hypothetical protein
MKPAPALLKPRAKGISSTSVEMCSCVDDGNPHRSASRASGSDVLMHFVHLSQKMVCLVGSVAMRTVRNLHVPVRVRDGLLVCIIKNMMSAVVKTVLCFRGSGVATSVPLLMPDISAQYARDPVRTRE